MDDGVVKGPVSARDLIGYFGGVIHSRDKRLILKEGVDNWVSIGSMIDEINKDIEAASKPAKDKCADNLLTASFIVFICAALAQFIAGAILWSNGSLAVGLPLTLSSLGYIFPISVSYVLRQMFRHQLRS